MFRILKESARRSQIASGPHVGAVPAGNPYRSSARAFGARERGVGRKSAQFRQEIHIVRPPRWRSSRLVRSARLVRTGASQERSSR